MWFWGWCSIKRQQLLDLFFAHENTSLHIITYLHQYIAGAAGIYVHPLYYGG
jgi:hypothetical protein